MDSLKKFSAPFIKEKLISFLTIFIFYVALAAGFMFLARNSFYARRYVLTLLIFADGFIVLLYAGLALVTRNDFKKGSMKLEQIAGFSKSRFERETEKSPKAKYLLLSSDAIVYMNNWRLCVIPINDVVWAYQETISAKAAACALVIWTRDKKVYNIRLRIKKKEGDPEKWYRYMMRLIARKRPAALIGYEDEYQECIRKEFSKLVRRSDEIATVSSEQLEQEYILHNYYEQDFH